MKLRFWHCTKTSFYLKGYGVRNTKSYIRPIKDEFINMKAFNVFFASLLFLLLLLLYLVIFTKLKMARLLNNCALNNLFKFTYTQSELVRLLTWKAI